MSPTDSTPLKQNPNIESHVWILTFQPSDDPTYIILGVYRTFEDCQRRVAENMAWFREYPSIYPNLWRMNAPDGFYQAGKHTVEVIDND